MKLRFAVTLCAAVSAGCAVAAAQDSSQANKTTAGTTSSNGLVSETIQVYKLGKDLAAPEVIPIDYSAVLDSDCERIEHIKTELKFIIDTTGLPQEIQLGNETDGNISQLLLQWMRTVKFKAAQRNGAPVAVGISDRINIDVCYEKTTDAAGNVGSYLRLHSVPTQEFERWKDAPKELTIYSLASDLQDGVNVEHIGGRVRPPVPVFTVNPAYSTEARSKKIQGTCYVKLIVDAHGVPQSTLVVRPLGYGLDQKAIEAVKEYRFKPATKDGKPVPVYLTIAIDFQLY